MTRPKWLQTAANIFDLVYKEKVGSHQSCGGPSRRDDL